ncbi:MAG TPA: hypothetical protein PK430_05510 [Muribaculum sp.]|jgi:hypothetical protein|uniref:Uncharacterized protein n=1 Tax=Heminiphilus faecis TaxID=2601703 RepID=A0ABV4CVJ4_9BACT|nr:hypothetical protein [Heminiphilus faecis]RLT76070.1 hypothetical protein D7V95_10345 [bacterium J10(2018)]HRF68665.1 hypothetical protein [Muribaculum sp.]
MGYYNDKFEIKGMTEENAKTLKESHETYDNPAYSGRVEIEKESDDTYTARYDRSDVKSFQHIHEDGELFGGHTDKLYQ